MKLKRSQSATVRRVRRDHVSTFQLFWIISDKVLDELTNMAYGEKGCDQDRNEKSDVDA
jgi:hypothetical protein